VDAKTHQYVMRLQEAGNHYFKFQRVGKFSKTFFGEFAYFKLIFNKSFMVINIAGLKNILINTLHT